ncbi:MAG: tRNA-binding protein [bacterium]|nr:tRNA-binding protein [bacterium]
MKQISWDEFEQVELRVGTIIKVEEFPEAREPTYKLRIDFGEEIGIKKSSAKITQLYSKEDLLNKQVVCVINFPPKQVGPFMSEVLTTGFVTDQDKITLAIPEHPVPNGSILA